MVFAVPREVVNGAVKLKMPVGDGGCRTFSRSGRKSPPNFIECRAWRHPTESKTCVISVLKSESVLVEGPSCCKPAIVKVGSSFWKAAFCGMPGNPRLCEGGESRSDARRSIERRVEAERNSLMTRWEKTCK